MAKMTVRSTGQLLRVLDGVQRNYGRAGLPEAYHDAVREVALTHQVAYQTIGDLCRRRLGFDSIDEFIALLREWLGGHPTRLQKRINEYSEIGGRLLVDKFFEHKDVSWDEVGPQPRHPRREGSASSVPASLDQNLQLRITPTLAQRLHLAQMVGIGSSREETAIALLERGFESEKERIRQFVEVALDPGSTTVQ